MKRSALVIVLAFVALAALHQDFWNWRSDALVLGFIPTGLAFHALYSLVAAAFWFLVMKFAWPTELEQWAEEE